MRHRIGLLEKGNTMSTSIADRPRARRLAAGLLAGALAATGLGLATGAPAQADEPASSLAWEVSSYFDTHLGTHTLDGGTTEDGDGVITFPGGSGTYNPDTGAGVVSYDGSVTGAFVAGPTEYYRVTIAEPQVQTYADGSGRITAVVSASNIETAQGPAASTSPTRVVVTTFTGGWDDGTLAATPDWAGVLPADSAQATALGIGAGKPVDGKAFAPSFLGQVTPGVRALFYASGSGSDPNKAPAGFTAHGGAATPAVTARIAGAAYEAGVDVTVDGTGFSAATQPGDAGVYVGVAEAGGLPDVSSPAGMDGFVAATWVPASGVVDGAISAALNLPTQDLVRGTDYAVYTWQAHSHSTTSQDTQTALSIDWDALRAPATVSATLTKAPRPDRRGTLKATVKGPQGTAKPTGKVTVTVLHKGKQVKVLSARLDRGRTTFTLPKLDRGRVKLKVAYLGSKSSLPGRTTVRFKIGA